MQGVRLVCEIVPIEHDVVIVRMGLSVLAHEIHDLLGRYDSSQPSTCRGDAKSAAQELLLQACEAGELLSTRLCHVATLAETWLSAECSSSAYTSLPHHAALHAAFEHFFSSDELAAYLVASALLERVLLEVASLVRTNAGRRPPSGTLLKDLVSNDELRQPLGTGAMELLAVLCSPAQLNLRNLVWHGFLAKNELPRRQTALLLLLLVHAAEALSVLRAIRAPDLSSAVERQGTLTQSTASTTSSSASPPDRTQVPPPRQLPPPHQPPPLDHGSPCFVPSAVRALWRPRDADAELLSAAQLLAGLCAFPPPPLSGGCRIILNAPWIRPGHVGSLCRALAAYACADYATFACLCTPILEAAVRCSFVWANPSERALEVARLDTYFATLDGYGQRAKHQLMLDTTLHSNGQPNRLAIVLGRGLHALLVDLFLHAAGPALRAKYAHAEAEMVAGEMGDEGTARAARVATSGERPTVDALHNTETEPPARTAAAVATATHSIDGPPPVAIQMLYAGLMALCVVSHGEGRLERLSRKHTRGCEAEVSQPVLGDGGEAARTGRAEMADGIGCAETADGRESMFAREDERMACARVATRQLIDRYYSQCHPLARLQRLRTRVGAALAAALGVGPLYQVEAQQAGVEDDGSKNGSNESIGDEMVDVTTPLTGGSTQTLSVACTLRPADATAAARVAALRDEAAHVACAGLAHGCDNADANCASIAGDGEATGEADGYAGSGDGGGADAEAAVECSRMGVLSSCERFLLLDERRLRELTERVERRTASTAQRRSFIYLCQATMAHRQLAAVLVSLVDQHPLVTPHSCCSPADANPLVPLAKLHVAAEALCAAFESGKTERVIAQGEALLKLARHKRRAIMNEHVC